MVIHEVRVYEPEIRVLVAGLDEDLRFKARDLPDDVRDVWELASWIAANVCPIPHPLMISINGCGIDEDLVGGDYGMFRHRDLIIFSQET